MRSKPTQPGFSAPPNGAGIPEPRSDAAHLPEMQQQLTMRTMPLGNLTNMTSRRNARAAAWIGHRRIDPI
jgi:uncharacterized membrane protein